jgi:hypothetical protein
MSQMVLHPTSEAVDGRVGREGDSAYFSALIAGNGNAVDYTDSRVVMRLNSVVSPAGLWAGIRRGVFLFKPAALPANAIIQGATFSLWISSAPTNYWQSKLVLTNAPVSHYGSLEVGDFQLLNAQKVEHGVNRVDVADLVDITGWTKVDWIVNEVGLVTFQSLYESGNVFELGLMFHWDFDELTPTVPWASATSDDIAFASAQWADSTYWPTLTVDYTIGGYSGCGEVPPPAWVSC